MKLGIIGFGNMARAIIKGNLKNNNIEEKNIYLANRTYKKLEDFQKEFSVHICKKNTEVVKECDVIILAVKPNVINSVLEEICDYITSEKIIISLSVATKIKDIENVIGDKKIIRVMPNTPMQVASGVAGVVINKKITAEDKQKVEKIFKDISLIEYFTEKELDAVSAISGSLPAYVYMFIEAVADGGVLNGLSREMSYKLVAQTILGSAKMVLESKKHPAQLKDEVTSPAGTTIEGLKILEENNFRASLIKSQLACVNKAKKMAEEN